jgi:hypothetical protein
MALGASARHVQASVVGQTLRLVVVAQRGLISTSTSRLSDWNPGTAPP